MHVQYLRSKCAVNFDFQDYQTRISLWYSYCIWILLEMQSDYTEPLHWFWQSISKINVWLCRLDITRTIVPQKRQLAITSVGISADQILFGKSRECWIQILRLQADFLFLYVSLNLLSFWPHRSPGNIKIHDKLVKNYKFRSF